MIGIRKERKLSGETWKVISPKKYPDNFLRRGLPTRAWTNPFTAGFLLKIEEWMLKNMRRFEKLEVWRIDNFEERLSWRKPH